MQLTFVTDLGQSYAVDIDPDMELENVMALLEAEVSRLLSTPLPSSPDQYMSIPCLSPRSSAHTMAWMVLSMILDHAVEYTPQRTKHFAQRARTYRSQGYHPGAWCGRACYAPLTQACQRPRARRQVST
jgi:hypothetical protein